MDTQNQAELKARKKAYKKAKKKAVRPWSILTGIFTCYDFLLPRSELLLKKYLGKIKA